MFEFKENPEKKRVIGNIVVEKAIVRPVKEFAVCSDNPYFNRYSFK